MPLDNSPDNAYGSRVGVRSGLGADRFQHLDPQQLRQMQQELEQGLPLDQNNRNNANDPTQGGIKPQNPNQLNRPLPDALETPANPALRNPALGAPLTPVEPLGSSLMTQEGSRRVLAGPAQQTPVYGELKNRMERYRTHAETPEEAAVKANGATGQGDIIIHSNNPAAGAEAGGAAGAAARPRGRPLAGRRTAAGVDRWRRRRPQPRPLGRAGRKSRQDCRRHRHRRAGGRHQDRARPRHQPDHRRQGQGAQRAAQEWRRPYEGGQVHQGGRAVHVGRAGRPQQSVDPGRPSRRRAGAATYRSAEQDLRRAFAGDPALLHAQYDLNAFLGEKRLAVITADLKDLAAKEPTSEMPAFLLAFVNYNTGHEAEAMNYLKDVEKREGKADPVVQRMREHWYVPPAGLRRRR